MGLQLNLRIGQGLMGTPQWRFRAVDISLLLSKSHGREAGRLLCRMNCRVEKTGKVGLPVSTTQAESTTLTSTCDPGYLGGG